MMGLEPPLKAEASSVHSPKRELDGHAVRRPTRSSRDKAYYKYWTRYRERHKETRHQYAVCGRPRHCGSFGCFGLLCTMFCRPEPKCRERERSQSSIHRNKKEAKWSSDCTSLANCFLHNSLFSFSFFFLIFNN